jgi:uncharacterized protein (TIGR00369 family)
MDAEASTRSHTFSWDDPTRARQDAAEMSGLELMTALRDGKLPPPPMAVLMGLAPVEVEPGRVVFSCTPLEAHYNPLGTVHGGMACTVLDTVTACAAHTTLEPGVGYTSIEIKVNYLRPILSTSGPLRATGTVTKTGSRVIFADGVLEDADGRTVATASSSLLVMR